MNKKSLAVLGVVVAFLTGWLMFASVGSRTQSAPPKPTKPTAVRRVSSPVVKNVSTSSMGRPVSTSVKIATDKVRTSVKVLPR